ncbi:putative MFS monosaccharide transporter [Aspergillus ibericus CBS 121593]|uniref:MFS monosaccharide transporter n=1 Tax=Aspergillus ibericus CBS 121593 TaxID=1448316 RepID=A0A395HAS6_9EURO|nr:MFS monosaccharide transporter [Aspergillus ibericus CBS 121593]RAL05017.1 MFS monosaccharide transporter [Aspergillus ibericus CBS 121593]
MKAHSPITTVNIPSTTSSAHTPSNIPLQSLHLRSQSSSSKAVEYISDRGSRRSSVSSPHSTGPEPFTWTDSGDLAEQLTDAEDPPRSRLINSLDCESSNQAKSSVRVGKQKRVRCPDRPGIGEDDIEKIEIPCPPLRKISRAERLLATIMSPNGQQNAQIHGLVGKPLLYFTSVFVSLGVFLFGYDQGVMSGIITGWYFKDYFNQPSRAAIGTVVAILEVGAFISSLLVGRIGDLIGRRKTILYGSIVFFIGGALQAFATGLPMMMAGRIVAGLGVGALSTIVPVYQSEISPPHSRGKLACIEFTGNISGYAASVWVDYLCSFIDSNYSWRIPLLCQCIMGALLGVGSLIICESPRWLLDNDYDEEGMVVIANLYGSGDLHNDKARQEYREIKMNVLLQRQEGERSYSDMFKRYYKRVLIAMSAQALAQLNGINVISYYAPLVFESAGWAGRDAILMTGINAISYLASTVPPWYLVDRWGRRPILLSGAVAMIISLSLISYFIYIDVVATPTLTVILVMIYNAAFGASWGPIPWLYPPEILPLSIRAKGASLSTATNWAFNWLVGEVTPVLQAAIKWRLYLVHAFFCACSFVLVYFLYPETSGVRLEDMNLLFGDATTAMPTPATQGERGSLMSAGSPVPSLDIRRQYGHLGADSAIPGLDIDPPNVSSTANTKPPRPGFREDTTSRPEGFGGWISKMITRHHGPRLPGQNSQYRRLGQEENE